MKKQKTKKKAIRRAKKRLSVKTKPKITVKPSKIELAKDKPAKDVYFDETGYGISPYSKNLQSKFNQMANNIDEVFFLSNINYQTLYLNPAFEKVWGLPVSAIMKDPRIWAESILPEDRGRYFQMSAENLKNGTSFSTEYRIKRPDGQIRNIKTRVVCIKNAKGEIDHVAGTAADITKEKDDEKRLKNILEQYDAITAASLTGISIVQDNVFKFVNTAFLNMFGYASEEVIGKPWSILATSEGQRHDLSSDIANSIQKQGEAANYKVEGKKKDGTKVLLNISSRNSSFNGSPAVVASTQDITEIEIARKKTEELNEMKNKFIQIVSHQMRMPLTTIRWSIERLLGGEIGGKLNTEHEEVIKVIYNSDLSIINRLSNLILSLDIENRILTLNKEQVSLESIVDSVLLELALDLRAKKLKINFSPSGAKYLVDVDARKIKQCVREILENAVHYSVDGSQIKILLEAKGDEVYLTVSDTGIGIPAPEQAGVFEKFFRASNATVKWPNASGLGLFISKNIIELHGGKIWFKSQEGVGSDFYFKLPLA